MAADKKPVVKAEGAPASTPVKAKREKKVYDLPGQTKETPVETDPLRMFYSSLLEQRPESEMAEKWCLQHGLIDKARVEEVAKKYARKQAKAEAKARVKKAAGATKKATAGNAKAAETKKRKAPAKAADKPKKAKAAQKPKPKKKPAPKPAESDSSDSDDDVPLASRMMQK